MKNILHLFLILALSYGIVTALIITKENFNEVITDLSNMQITNKVFGGICYANAGLISGYLNLDEFKAHTMLYTVNPMISKPDRYINSLFYNTNGSINDAFMYKMKEGNIQFHAFTFNKIINNTYHEKLQMILNDNGLFPPIHEYINTYMLNLVYIDNDYVIHGHTTSLFTFANNSYYIYDSNFPNIYFNSLDYILKDNYDIKIISLVSHIDMNISYYKLPLAKEYYNAIVDVFIDRKKYDSYKWFKMSPKEKIKSFIYSKYYANYTWGNEFHNMYIDSTDIKHNSIEKLLLNDIQDYYAYGNNFEYIYSTFNLELAYYKSSFLRLASYVQEYNQRLNYKLQSKYDSYFIYKPKLTHYNTNTTITGNYDTGNYDTDKYIYDYNNKWIGITSLILFILSHYINV